MMNIYLIYPTYKNTATEPSLGLMYIASVLRDSGCHVEIIEGDYHTITSLLRLRIGAADEAIDFVGITCMTSMYNEIIKLRDFFHRNNIRIVFGGVHATIMPDTLLQAGFSDICVIGEGEATIIDIVSNYDDVLDEKLDEIQGIAYIPKDSISMKFTAKRPFIDDLNVLPFPSRDLIDKKYFKHKSTTILASRGCQFNCSFCQPTLRKLFGNFIRRRDPKDVVQEMENCNNEFGIKHFEFFDDTFTSNNVWVLSFCEVVKSTGFTWEALARVDTIDYNILKLMKSAGLKRISLGFESGSQTILNTYCKGITIEQGHQALDWCKQLGIKVHGYFMLGAIDETQESMKATKDFIMEQNSKLDTIFVTITTPTPCTRLYDQAIEQDRLLVSWDKIDLLGSLFRLTAPKDYDHTVAMKLKYLTNNDVLTARYDILKSFYFKKIRHPAYLLTFIRKKSLKYLWYAATSVLDGAR